MKSLNDKQFEKLRDETFDFLDAKYKNLSEDDAYEFAHYLTYICMTRFLAEGYCVHTLANIIKQIYKSVCINNIKVQERMSKKAIKEFGIN